jgi:hypothetical protein
MIECPVEQRWTSIVKKGLPCIGGAMLVVGVVLGGTRCEGRRERVRSVPAAKAENLLLVVPDCVSGGECEWVVKRLALTTALPSRALLDSLGALLSGTFFAEYGERTTDVRFRVYSIETVATPSRPLPVGVIDIVDTAQTAMRTFFQGSTGASLTETVLQANFLQPQLHTPFLEGVVFLYNGELLSEMAHLDLSGIQTPESVDPRVRLLLRRRAPKG